MPVAILLLGIGGVGKSRTADCVHDSLRQLGYNCLCIRFDGLRKQLVPQGADPFSSNPTVKQEIYWRAGSLFAEQLSVGTSLVIDCGLSVERIRLELKSRVSGLRIVHLYCPFIVAFYRDVKRSIFQRNHERGRFLHIRAISCRLLGRKAGHPQFFPQPGITYDFEYPDCADLHVNTAWRRPKQVSTTILRAFDIG